MDKIKNVAQRLGIITVEDMERYTALELMLAIANKVNELIIDVERFESDVDEVVISQNEKIQYLLDEGLLLEVTAIFDGWVEDGTFDRLINQSALKEVNAQLSEINRIKANKSEVFLKANGININDFDEDTRRAFLEAQGINVDYVLGDGNVKPENTSFMNRHINLYDNKSVNGLGINTSGTTYPVTGAFTSSYIDIVEGLQIYTMFIARIAFYDSSNTLLGVNSYNTDELKAITIPTGSTKFRYYIEANNILSGFITQCDKLIVEEYGYKMPLEYLSINELLQFIKNASDIIEITEENCSFFEKMTNLYDNKTINGLGLGNTGTTRPVTGGFVSDFNKIEKSIISKYKVGRVCFYDTSKSFITVDLSNSTNGVVNIKVPTNAEYFKYEVASDNISQAIVINTDKELADISLSPKLKEGLVDITLITEDVIKRMNDNKLICCYGDSLTEGAGSGNAGVYSYPAQLSTLIANSNGGYSVVNRGIGGETSARILMRQGCYANFDMVNPFTIPSDASQVKITKTGSIGNPIGGNTAIKNGVNPVTIKGVKGNLSYNNGFYFTRLESGNSVTIDRPTPLWTASALEDKGKILISCFGQNDNKESSDFIEDIIRKHRAMIDFNGSGKYIVLGLPTGTEIDRRELELELKKEYGSNFLNIRDYLFNFGLADNNLTPTSEDQEDIANGIIPRQLRSDDVHLNQYGYYSMAKAIYSLGQELGYWK